MEKLHIKDLPLSGSGASQKLWKVNGRWVVTCAVYAFSGPETYVVPANAAGKITDWGELPGSFRGALDHDAAIDGYVASLVQEGNGDG